MGAEYQRVGLGPGVAQAISDAVPLQLETKRLAVELPFHQRLADPPVGTQTEAFAADRSLKAIGKSGYGQSVLVIAGPDDPIIADTAFVAGHLAADHRRALLIGKMNGGGHSGDHLGPVMDGGGGMESVGVLLGDKSG